MRTKTKTIEEWLEQLPEGYRELAIDQANDPDARVASLGSAIVNFTEEWYETEEGAEFWDLVHEWAIGREDTLPPLPDDECRIEIPKGYYRVDEGKYKEGDMVVFTTASKSGFSPVSYTHVGCAIRAPYVVARPMHGYFDEGDTKPLPDDADERKTYPIYSGFIAYFPHAIAAVANLSHQGNQQHHPDKPLHWDMDKSRDELDALCRHMIDGIDGNIDEATRVAWRAMANLERKLTGKCNYDEDND